MGPELRSPIMTTQNAAFIPLTKQAVADHLDISARSVENWINEGILPAPVKLGNRVYWHPDVFFGWLSKRLQEPTVEGQEVKPTRLDERPSKGSSNAVGETLRTRTQRKLARLQENASEAIQ